MYIISSFFNAIPLENDNIFNSYLNYINDYDKKYTNNDFWKRYSIFQNNVKYINYKNNITKDYNLGLNRFTDMSPLEFKNIYLKNKYTPNTKLVNRRSV